MSWAESFDSWRRNHTSTDRTAALPIPLRKLLPWQRFSAPDSQLDSRSHCHMREA